MNSIQLSNDVFQNDKAARKDRRFKRFMRDIDTFYIKKALSDYLRSYGKIGRIRYLYNFTRDHISDYFTITATCRSVSGELLALHRKVSF